METAPKALHDFLELLNQYPSPHNGQPIRLKQTTDSTFEVYFQKERGLQATDISFIFSFVSMGVFVEYAAQCAQALGHSLEYVLSLPAESELRGTGEAKFAELTIQWRAKAADDFLAAALRFRQTSRKKYYEGLTDELSMATVRTAEESGMKLSKLSKEQAAQAIWLNQRAVFDDMFDHAVQQELDHWLRYSKEEKEAKRDGLAYDCMELNGRLMKFIVHHPHILRTPGLSGMIKRYYLRTMADASDVFYMLAPFATEKQSFDVGTVITQVWVDLSRQGYYLHPFGTIMSNHAAHQDFLELAGVANESRESNYLVFIFRAGKSEVPVKSLRLPYEKHLMMEEHD